MDSPDRRESLVGDISGAPRSSITSDGSTPRRVASGAEANPLLAAIRREVKASEERLTERVVRVERRAEQFREAAFSSLDEKFSELKGKQPEYDRKFAEMGGCVTGVQEELQALIRRVSGIDHSHTQRRSEESQTFRSKMADLEQQLQRLDERSDSSSSEELRLEVNERCRRLQTSFDEIAAGTGRLGLAEVQIERLMDTLERNDPPAGGALCSPQPSVSQLLQCERAAREAEETAEKAARDAERLALQVRQALTQTEEQNARMHQLIERVLQNEQQIRTIAARAEVAASEPLESSAAAFDVGRQPRGSLQSEVDEVKYELERHWQGVLEVKEAVNRVNEKFHRDLKAIREAQHVQQTELQAIQQADLGRSGGSQQTEPGRSSGSWSFVAGDGDGSRAPLVREVEALRECIVKSEVAIQQLAPKLLEAASGSKDPHLLQSARGLYSAACQRREGEQPEDSQDEEYSEVHSPSQSREDPLSPARSRRAHASSCFSGCFRGMS